MEAPIKDIQTKRYLESSSDQKRECLKTNLKITWAKTTIAIKETRKKSELLAILSIR